MIWSTVSKIQSKNILKLVILGHFLPFYPLQTPKIKVLKIERFYWYTQIISPNTPLWATKSKFLKNEKNTWRYYHFTNVFHKWQSYDVWFVRYGVQRTECFVIFDRFLHFYKKTIWKIKILKKWKKHLEISFYTGAP